MHLEQGHKTRERLVWEAEKEREGIENEYVVDSVDAVVNEWKRCTVYHFQGRVVPEEYTLDRRPVYHTHFVHSNFTLSSFFT